MTTIAANREGMACDSRTSWDADFFSCEDKIERINGSLIGCAGKVASIFKFLAWFRNQSSERPDLDDDDFQALEVNKHGIFYYCGGTYPSRVCNQFVAIGSGSLAAQAAMFCGKTPKEAVAVAIRCDKNSAGPVRSFALKEPK